MSFLLSIALFALASIFVFTIPGIYALLLTKKKFLLMEKVFLGTIVGFVGFTLFSYLLVLLRLDILLIPAYALVNFFIYKKVVKYLKVKESHSKNKFILLLVVFTIGIAGQLAIIAPSGISINGDILFWSSHAHDGSWHIALMEEIKKGGTLQNPIFAGERLVNYHFFSDVAPAMFSKYLRISNLDLYFRFFALFYSVLLGASAYLLVKKITKSVGASLWAVFFTYFAGSFGFIVTYLKDGSLRGESIFWATQIQSSSGNPPQIISNFLVLTYLYFFYLLVKKRSWQIFLILTILLGSLALFKVYAAIALLLPTLLVGVWQFIRNRSIYFLSLGGLSGALAAVLYLPNASAGTSFLIFQPWWYVRTMIVEPSRLDWVDHELRRQTYIYENNWKRVIYLESQGFFIFLFGNLGMRFLGFWDFIKYGRTSFKNYFNLLFVLIIILSVAFPLLFLQKGVASNTSQSFQYFILLFGLLAGISTNQFIEHLKFVPLKVTVAVIIVILSIPTQLGLLKEFYSRAAFTKISSEEVEALAYIRNNTPSDSVVLTPPYDPNLNLKAEIPEVWDWFDTAYVSALSSRRTYFDDFEQVDIMGYEFDGRKETKQTIFTSSDEVTVKKSLDSTKAKILYFPKILRPIIEPQTLGFTRLFQNKKVEVWGK